MLSRPSPTPPPDDGPDPATQADNEARIAAFPSNLFQARLPLRVSRSWPLQPNGVPSPPGASTTLLLPLTVTAASAFTVSLRMRKECLLYSPLSLLYSPLNK